MLKLKAGELVEVLSKEEILMTLDQTGRLEKLPFMPQMFEYCGKQFRVYKRAHKTCDTVNKTGGLRMNAAVHLEGLRCDGQAYGGCQAECLIFWKEAWLRRVGNEPAQAPKCPTVSSPSHEVCSLENAVCREDNVLRSTRAEGKRESSDDPTYICQATTLPEASKPLKWWELDQYWEDYVSGNTGLWRLFRGLVYAAYYALIQSGLGLGAILRALYDAFQSFWKGVPFPRKTGRLPSGEKTPSLSLHLQPGDFVRIKSYEEILNTLDRTNRNKGLYFDAEMVPYCGGVYRVRKRVHQILNEKTGKMMRMKNECIMLEGVTCQSRYSDRRYFCPRSIYSYWREIWLERIDAQHAPEICPVSTLIRK